MDNPDNTLTPEELEKLKEIQESRNKFKKTIYKNFYIRKYFCLCIPYKKNIYS